MLGAPAKTKETANVLTTLSNASQQLLRMLPTSPDHVQNIQQVRALAPAATPPTGRGVHVRLAPLPSAAMCPQLLILSPSIQL